MLPPHWHWQQPRQQTARLCDPANDRYVPAGGQVLRHGTRVATPTRSQRLGDNHPTRESESVRVFELKGPLRYEHQVLVLLHSSRLRSKAWTAQSHFTRGLIQGRAATMP